MLRLFTDSVFYHCTVHQAKNPLPHLLMLHGFMGSGKVFKPLIGDLTSFCNPITIDLAGHGKTETPNHARLLSSRRQVKQIHSVLDRLQFPKIFLYGYSMGGRLAFQLISTYPELFAGAIIESAHCGIPSKKDKQERAKLDNRRADQIEKNFGAFVDSWINLPLFSHTPQEAKTIYEQINRSQKPELMSRSLREFGAGAMPHICGSLPNNLPTRLICGSLDGKYVSIAQNLARNQSNFHLHVVKNAGHRVHTDQPLEVINIIKEAVNPVHYQTDL